MRACGEMAEWSKARDSKSRIPQGIQGSNPCLSATLRRVRAHANRRRCEAHDAPEERVVLRTCIDAEQRIAVAGERIVDLSPVAVSEMCAGEWQQAVFFRAHMFPV